MEDSTTIDKEVFFDKYCQTCKHVSEDSTAGACDDCLEVPTMPYSHKPINYEKASD